MKRGFLLTACLALLLCACGGRQKAQEQDGLQREASALLSDWLGGLVARQQRSVDPALDGGLLCPACQRVHGRCADAVLPLMYTADRTGDRTYLDAAVRLWEWMERNTSMPDGSWVNDVNISDWKGTTVFTVIAVGEALRDYGDLLPEAVQDAWWKRLERAAQSIYDDDPNFSRRHGLAWNQNVNYSASAPYALWLVGKRLDRRDFLAKAAQIAGDMKACFSPDDCLLYGEAPVMGPSSKGAYPVDLGYNVEESLPNLASYAVAAGDDSLRVLVGRSMRTHLEFMLPDGAWDNSWGTRSFKWTYWGSRTSDGMAAGYGLYVGEYPEFRTAIRRNVELLRAATVDGMLYGGMHYRSGGQPACDHHTFSHARGLASFLAHYESCREESLGLPREEEYGVREFPDIRTWLVSVGGWRATVTDLDCEYRVRNTHPKGGALSLLWHRDAGPVFAAGMNPYQLIEPTNMQMDRQQVTSSPTPRIEYIAGDCRYTNIDDPQAAVEYDGTVFRITGSLVDADWKVPAQGPVRVALEYRFDAEECVLTVELLTPVRQGEVHLVLPFVAESGLQCTTGENWFFLHRPGATLRCHADAPLRIGEVNPGGRILCFTPGFEVIPVEVSLSCNVPVRVVLDVARN